MMVERPCWKMSIYTENNISTPSMNKMGEIKKRGRHQITIDYFIVWTYSMFL
jgi:hypothetical protein